MASPVVQLRVPEDMLAAIDGALGGGNRSAWILALIERGLLDDGTGTPAPGPAGSPAGAIPDLGQGEPSPGVICMGPGCWQRDTSRYGLRELPLCPGCAAALEGKPYQRQAPPGAARIMRGAA